MEGVLRMCQLNCQRSSAVMNELGNYMCENGISVGMLQEPYVVGGEVRGLPVDFKVVRSANGVNGSVGSVVVVNGFDLDVMVVEEYTCELGVCVWVKGRLGEMYVVSVYCRFGEELGPYVEYLDRVRIMCGDVCMVVGMDANACSPLWHSKSRGSAARSVLLEDWVVAGDMVVLNEPSEWFTFSGPRGDSDIDVTLSNAAGGMYEFEWMVDPGGSISDHNVVRVDVRGRGAPVGESEVVGKRWCTNGVDWRGYVEDLRVAACGFEEFEGKSVDEKVGLLTRWVAEVNDRHMRVRRKANRTHARWWTRALSERRLEVRALRKAYQRARRGDGAADEQWRAYRVGVSAYKSELKEVKTRHWRDFVREDGNRDVWGPVYRLCMGRRKAADICSMKVGGESTTSWEGSVNALLDSFFPVSGAVAEGGVDRVHEAGAGARGFTDEEIGGAVFRTRVRRAPGLDGVNGEMMRGVWRAIPEYVGCLYNQCLNEGYFPDEWKKSDLVVLLKSPDKVRSDPSSYRPICLLPVMGKVLERVMVNRLGDRLAEEGESGSQFGFKSGKSTEDAWMRVKEVVGESDGSYVLGIFVDFKGAFDNLVWGRVIEKLAEVGCGEMGLWRSYFRDRRVCMRGVNSVVWKNVERGCPQGSVGGPAVWNMMIEELLVVLGRCECRVVAYADDLLIVVDGDSRADIERKGTDCLRYVTAWGEYVGVEVSARKTECMLLRGSLARSRPPNVRLGASGVRYSARVKYLGVVVGERMNFRPHLEYLREKLFRVVGMLRRVLRRDWGLRRTAVRVLYGGLFVACMSYGSCVWSEVLRYGYARTLLGRMQRMVLYACLNVCRTVSVDAMQVLAGVLPWDLEVSRRDVLYRAGRGVALMDGGHVASQEILGMSVGERKRFVAERMTDVWQDRWDSSSKGRGTYRFIRDVRLVGMCDGFDPSLRLCYLLTGHGSMNGYLYERSLCDVSECLCGVPVESVDHLISECVIYGDLRDLDGCGVTVDGQGGLDVSGVLGSRGTYECMAVFADALFRRRDGLMSADG